LNQKLRDNLEYFIDGNKEFKYLKTISKTANVDYIKAVDYCLDCYNWERKDNIEIRESKVQALCLTTMYVKGLMIQRNQVQGDSDEC
jgi:hypothetical protein